MCERHRWHNGALPLRCHAVALPRVDLKQAIPPQCVRATPLLFRQGGYARLGCWREGTCKWRKLLPRQLINSLWLWSFLLPIRLRSSTLALPIALPMFDVCAQLSGPVGAEADPPPATFQIAYRLHNVQWNALSVTIHAHNYYTIK